MFQNVSTNVLHYIMTGAVPGLYTKQWLSVRISSVLTGILHLNLNGRHRIALLRTEGKALTSEPSHCIHPPMQ
jgi:hypothetical protein